MEESLKSRHEKRRMEYLDKVKQTKGSDLEEIDRQRKLRRQEDEERIRKKMEEERVVYFVFIVPWSLLIILQVRLEKESNDHKFQEQQLEKRRLKLEDERRKLQDAEVAEHRRVCVY